MYVIYIIDDNIELVVSAKDIGKMANLLEATKQKFKVFSRCDKLEQSFFGFGDFKYWA